MKFSDVKKIVQRATILAVRGATILAVVKHTSIDREYRGRTGEVDKVLNDDTVVVRFLPRPGSQTTHYRYYDHTDLDFVEKMSSEPAAETSREETHVSIDFDEVKTNYTTRRILAREKGFPGDIPGVVVATSPSDIVQLQYDDRARRRVVANQLIFWYDDTSPKFFVGDKITVVGTVESIHGNGIVTSFKGTFGHLRFDNPADVTLVASGLPDEPADGSYVTIVAKGDTFASESYVLVRDDKRVEHSHPDTMKTRYPNRWYRPGAVMPDGGLSWPELHEKGRVEVIGRP